jgi:hypothetical protein
MPSTSNLKKLFPQSKDSRFLIFGREREFFLKKLEIIMNHELHLLSLGGLSILTMIGTNLRLNNPEY